MTRLVVMTFAPNIRCEEIDELNGAGIDLVNRDLAVAKSSNVTLRLAIPCLEGAV